MMQYRNLKPGEVVPALSTRWLGYARSGKEMEVRDAIRDMGMDCEVPLKVEALRRGKRRYAEAVITPFISNYLFLTLTADQWHQLHGSGIKHLAPTMTNMPREHVCGPNCLAPCSGAKMRVADFLEAVRSDYESRMARIEAGQRVEEYAPGDAIVIFAGSFAGMTATFRRIVEASWEDFPEVEAEMLLMGRAVPVRIDMLSVRKATA